MPFHDVTETDWSSSCGSRKSVSNCDFAAGAVHSLRAELTAMVKRQNIVKCPIVPDISLRIDVNWHSGGTQKMISKIERDYRRYRDIPYNDAGTPSDVTANVEVVSEERFA